MRVPPAPTSPSLDYQLPDGFAANALVNQKSWRAAKRIFFGSYGLMLGALLIFGGAQSFAKEALPCLFAAAMITMWTVLPYMGWSRHMERARAQLSLLNHDYSWYRQAFPSHVDETGTVKCRHCGSTNVAVREPVQLQLTSGQARPHICQQCGKTLYVSLHG